MPPLVFLSGKSELSKRYVLIWKWLQTSAKAAVSDSIEDALDYKAISKRIIQFVEDSRYELIETLIEKVAEISASRKFEIPWVSVSRSANLVLCADRAMWASQLNVAMQ